ncbi:TonB-dependent receptor [Thalassomonas sp. RHCl1]|uniref:TonB-dependent receptor domain-containing protein n=1 Tax=Thalassomonas sp. RHCl1 TaxID=2995320 RepID=UPI00248CB95D|nr:TonB-dependent receptor [Thalassomonas sp. RHCl1]
MYISSKVARAVKLALIFGTASTALLTPTSLLAEEAQAEQEVERIAVTGSRIRRPGAVSASPILSMDSEEMSYMQEPEVEKVLRVLPGTTPGDGSNANNGTAGAATVNLRGLEPERSLVLMNGRRLVPFNYDGQVDTATIPTALVDRVDLVTGGASAVYGSDAIAGAVNFIMKNNFEGVALEYNFSETEEGDGTRDTISLTLGSNLEDGRGNVAVSASWMSREAIMLGDRDLGLLGIDTASGAGYEQFQNGEPPVDPIAGCGGPNTVDFVQGSGSTTSIPTRFAIVGAGAAASGQFRDDGTIGEECSRFNFNPFNFYQTPQERYSATAIAHYDINDDVRAYTTFNYSKVRVDAQVAPSGTFGASFDLPLANPLIGDQARQWMIDAGNTAVGNGLLEDGGSWNDVNGNGVVDSEDYLTVQLRRRTAELGARTELYDTDQFQILAGFEGTLYEDWGFDISYQYGESNRVTTRGGYTNLTNVQNALDSVDGVTCANGDTNCVPINLFGGFGTITDEMAAYAQAIALQTQRYEQTVAQLVIDGPIEFIEVPGVGEPLSISIGFEHRQEKGTLTPDECLKLAPASCQGGAGGNLLPISGGYKADEIFFEGILPIFDGAEYADTLDLEFGYRAADYDSVGNVSTWKLGFSWRPVDDLLIRVMQQSATRAPNVGEIASPVVTGLDNALQDPCSVANAANIDDTLRQLCISTGMTDAQVGQVQDVISGQINSIDGSDPENLPSEEEADTFTAGFVWSSDFLDDFTITVDYYDIDIDDVIGEFTAQEVLDACYINGLASECEKINRIGGDLTVAGSGVELFTTNLKNQKAEGIEVGVNFNVKLGDMGDLALSANINKYLTHEKQASDVQPVIDCNGYFGTSCDPVSELRWVQRTTWTYEDFTVSLLWRHMSSIEVEPFQYAAATAEGGPGYFDAFKKIDSADYVDLFASYHYGDHMKFTFGVDNLFEEDPPVVGGEAGSTQYNSGNTFPSNYDVLGRLYKVGVKFEF